MATKAASAAPRRLRNNSLRPGYTPQLPCHPKRPGALEIQVLHGLGEVEDVLLARFDFVAHEIGEDLLGLDRVLDGNPFEAAVPDLHRGLGELLGIHLAQALVLLDDEVFAVLADDRLELGLAERVPR